MCKWVLLRSGAVLVTVALLGACSSSKPAATNTTSTTATTVAPSTTTSAPAPVTTTANTVAGDRAAYSTSEDEMEGNLGPLIGAGLIDPTEYQTQLYAPSVAALPPFIATLRGLHATARIAADAQADAQAYAALLTLLGKLHQSQSATAATATLAQFNVALQAARAPDDKLRADLGLPPGTLH